MRIEWVESGCGGEYRKLVSPVYGLVSLQLFFACVGGANGVQRQMLNITFQVERLDGPPMSGGGQKLRACAAPSKQVPLSRVIIL